MSRSRVPGSPLRPGPRVAPPVPVSATSVSPPDLVPPAFQTTAERSRSAQSAPDRGCDPFQMRRKGRSSAGWNAAGSKAGPGRVTSVRSLDPVPPAFRPKAERPRSAHSAPDRGCSPFQVRRNGRSGAGRNAAGSKGGRAGPRPASRAGLGTGPARRPTPQRSSVSSQIVNGPSFVSWTAISSPNRPVATSTPSARRAAATRS